MRAVLRATLILLTSHWYLLDTATSDLAASQLRGNDGSGAPALQMVAASRQAKRPTYRTTECDGARRLLGMRVENQDGLPVGTLQDFIIDVSSGQLTFALVGSAGFLGWHKQYRVLPPELISSATAKRGVLELECGNVHWCHAPRFSYSQLSSLQKPDQRLRIYRYYHVAVGASPKIDAGGSVVLSPTGRFGSGWRRLTLATAVIGKPVVNLQNEFVGVLSDLLVDLKGRKPVLAVFSSGKMSQGSFAAWLPLIREGGANGFVVDVARGAFTQAPSLNEHSWVSAPEQGPKAIFRLVDRSTNPVDTEPQ